MRTRAKLEEEISTLAAEVRALAHRRGAGLPDDDTLVQFLLAAFAVERAYEVGTAVDARGVGAIGEAVGELQLAPAAEPVRACVVAVFQAMGEEDFPAYRRESQALREALVLLLEARAAKWRQLPAARELYSMASRNAAYPAEQVRATVAKLNRWQVLVWAGRALACAAEDVWLWRFWQTGWRDYQEALCQRGQSGRSEEAWERGIAQHELPEAEALVVDSWPVPPDVDWPEGSMKAQLPQVRRWQAEQGALDGALDRLSRATGTTRPRAGAGSTGPGTE